MNSSILLHPDQLREMCRNTNEFPYALQSIFKRALQKVSSSSGKNFFYGSDYNDCHGDYYDADYK